MTDRGDAKSTGSASKGSTTAGAFGVTCDGEAGRTKPVPAVVAAERKPGRSIIDIAASLGRPITFVEAILEDEQKRGNVEHVDGRWRLTASAREQFGAALRHVDPYSEDRW